MKSTQNILATLALAAGLACSANGAESDSGSVHIPPPVSLRVPSLQPTLPAVTGPNEKTFWGWGLGLIFTEIPISQSQFTVLISDLHYGYYLTDPNDFVRTAATLGVYGFALVLPVPKVGIEMIVGDPSQAVQAKVGATGFYDISVGGHGGIAGEFGVRLKNKVDVMFTVVPAGTDSKRDYLEFVGVHDEPGPKPYVIMPYYGIFVSFNY